MDSPCINICILDEERGLCRGCLRSLDEIGNWSFYTEAERKRIMAELAERRASTDFEQQHPGRST